MTRVSAMNLYDDLQGLIYYSLYDLNELSGYGNGVKVLQDDLISQDQTGNSMANAYTGYWQATYDNLVDVLLRHEKEDYESDFKEAKQTFMSILDQLISVGDEENLWPA